MFFNTLDLIESIMRTEGAKVGHQSGGGAGGRRPTTTTTTTATTITTTTGRTDIPTLPNS